MVRRGPFRGLRYPTCAVGRANALVPKLLGAFEDEIAPPIERAIAANYDVFVDVGCADGYYVTGFALRSPRSQVYGYETDVAQRRLAATMGRVNGVSERVVLRGTCTVESFTGLPAGRLFVLMDCEGCEIDLLKPSEIPRIREATVLVEMHPTVHRDIGRILSERFAVTHERTCFVNTVRQLDDYPELAEISCDDPVLLVGQRRAPPGTDTWALFTPR